MALSLYDLNNSISTEVSTRTAQSTTTSTGLSMGLSTELSTRTSADLVLTNNLSTEVSIRTAQSTTTSTGLSTRTSTDLVLTNNLSTEVSQRTSADLVLTNNLSTEVSQRTSADTATSVATSIAISTAISTEASIRASADSGLGADIPTADQITVTDIADNTRVNLGNNVTNVQALADTVNTFGILTMVKSAIDGNLIYTIITYNRPAGGTKFMTSTLSGGTSPSYTTRTEVYYDTNGTTVLATKVYTIAYDGNGIVLSETCA